MSSQGEAEEEDDGGLFFADAQLDLSEAHDIAETPEPTAKHTIRKKPVEVQSIRLPSLHDDNNGNGVIGNTSDQHHPGTNSHTIQSVVTATSATSSATQLDDNDNDDDRALSRITSLETSAGRSRVVIPRRPRNIPVWPRDLTWGLAFLAVVPLGLVGPIVRSSSNSNANANDTSSSAAATTTHVLNARPLCTHSLQALIWAAVVAAFLGRRLLYRPTSVAAHLAAAPPLAVGISALVTLTVVWTCTDVWWTAVVPLIWTCQDVYLVRRAKQQQQQQQQNQTGGRDDLRPASPPPHSQYAFFQALVQTSLDILGRSLRRVAVWRLVLVVLGWQIVCVCLWRWALLRALSASSSRWLLLWTWLAGFWATSVLRRIITLVTSGGVLCWLDEQHNQQQASGNDAEGAWANAASHEDGGEYTMPEAYRSVDARVYTTVLSHDDEEEDDDDGIDIDFDDDLNDDFESPTRAAAARRAAASAAAPPPTVKRLLRVALTVSFGSVAVCGLVGGLAQFVWSQLHKIQVNWSNQFRGMSIGQATSEQQPRMATVSAYSDAGLRGAWYLVRQYNDMGMAHVATYHKAYSKASRDVLTLVEIAHVQGIWQADVTSHMLACVAGGVAGLIVLVTNFMALHQLNRGDGASASVTDWNVVQNMGLSWMLSYSLLLTVLEPLRASIKAVYVGFCQYPTSLAQAFPLIYHRLRRLSSESSNLV